MEDIERGDRRGAIEEIADIRLLLPVAAEHQHDDRLVEPQLRYGRGVVVREQNADPLLLSVPVDAIADTVEKIRL